MSIQKNIGKNTIGDNNKMSVSLHEYNMSTHDLSTIVSNSYSAAISGNKTKRSLSARSVKKFDTACD